MQPLLNHQGSFSQALAGLSLPSVSSSYPSGWLWLSSGNQAIHWARKYVELSVPKNIGDPLILCCESSTTRKSNTNWRRSGAEASGRALSKIFWVNSGISMLYSCVSMFSISTIYVGNIVEKSIRGLFLSVPIKSNKFYYYFASFYAWLLTWSINIVL